MDTDCAKSCDDFQRELETAKDSLVVLNVSIKRIVGRSKQTKDCRSDKKNPYEARQYEIDGLKNKLPESSLNKRDYDSKSVFNRLSTPSTRYIDELKPRVTSRVIRELPSRQEIVDAQCADSESRARNRRMFGSLLGTLHKFSQEESRLKQKEEKKAKIEKRLEEQELLERESLKRERQSLFYYRKRKQMEIKSLEQKISRVRDFEAWEVSMNSLKPFIKTKASPNIYFKPKMLNIETEKLLAECQAAICKLIHDRKTVLNQDLMALEENLNIADSDVGERNCLETNELLRNIQCSPVSANDSCARITNEGKSGLDFKENKIRTLSDPLLNSGVVVVEYRRL